VIVRVGHKKAQFATGGERERSVCLCVGFWTGQYAKCLGDLQ
jgi:hypothetical protein